MSALRVLLERPDVRMRPGARQGATAASLGLLVLLHCVAAHDGGDSQRSVLKDVQSYEVTYPVWLHPHRLTRSASREHPAETQVLISVEGQELKLLLERNEQLLAPGYQEIWYTPDGRRKSSSPLDTGHCLYHGKVQGVDDSSVAVSTCEGLRGLVSLNTSVSYLIQPVPVSTDAERHVVFRADSLRLPRGQCLHHHGNAEQEGGLGNFIQGMTSSHRERRDVSQNMKYVELLLVADKAEFVKHGSSLERTKLKLLEAANLVDKYYKALNIRVALIGLEVWTEQDLINVSNNPHSTLAAFLSWRRKQLRSLPNDNAQLITGVSFQGTTIGLAPLRAMCSDYQSGGVNTDHSEVAVGVAATMAHEMGHNFGMSHDSAGCCPADTDEGGCIMAAATGHPFPRVFNACNQKELKSYLNSGGGKCLFNLPNTRTLYGGQRCGNGYLEEGEECDCGEEEECTSPCCNANNCTLKAGAECAHGVCCQNCKLKSPGVLCRAPTGSCDLAEYCNGKEETCPANYYLVDGSPCAGGHAYCYTGMCLTLQQQCRSIWGQDGRAAPDLCFQMVNAAGDMYGNCGKDLFGKYRKCKERDAMCGKIQCVTSSSKPIETNAVPIETTITMGSRKVFCKGTHVYKHGMVDEDVQGDTLDPGLVMAGTKCGPDSICFNGECRNASFLQADECNTKCHGHGLCNNNHNCHCDVGWSPPFCDKAGSGGSVDSGPIIGHSHLLPVLVVLPLVLFVVLAALGLWCCCKHKLRPLKSAAPATVPSCSIPVEAKPLQADGLVNGHANPTFLLKKQDSVNLGKSSPRLRQTLVRPTVKPPPVPGPATAQMPLDSRRQSPPLRRNPPTAPPTAPKPRPDPPNRPPPPCPVSKTPGEQDKRQPISVSPSATSALAPSAGKKHPNRS